MADLSTQQLEINFEAKQPAPANENKVLENKVLTVEQLNKSVKQLIEGQLNFIWVQGEISNFKAHSSGHYYFALKDSRSQIRAVMFRGYNSRLKFKPYDGLEVIVRGRVTVYEPRGEYQIACEMMEPVGAGALQKAFEELKQKLKQEGLFEAARKRPLPLLPRHVAIVTSPTGAAIRDMMNVLSRRNKSVQITLVPTVVQGPTAAPLICEALNKAFSLPNVDAIIVGRGGGSIEDMWCFNDEALARLIAQSPVPIISAVGHEIDFTIADFVADVRAPTPSAAAELVVSSSEELAHKIINLRRMLNICMQRLLKTESQRLLGFSKRLVDPKRRIQDLVLRNDELFNRSLKAAKVGIQQRRFQVQLLERRLPSPLQIVEFKKSSLNKLELRLNNAISTWLKQKKFQLSRSISLLDSLSPLRVLERGYSLTMKNEQVVTQAQQLQAGDQVRIRLMQGSVSAEVKQVFLDKGQ